MADFQSVDVGFESHQEYQTWPYRIVDIICPCLGWDESSILSRAAKIVTREQQSRPDRVVVIATYLGKGKRPSLYGNSRSCGKLLASRYKLPAWFVVRDHMPL